MQFFYLWITIVSRNYIGTPAKYLCSTCCDMLHEIVGENFQLNKEQYLEATERKNLRTYVF
jgi:hypothetical protein